MSANSGQAIYNRAIVVGQTPAGEPVRAEVAAAMAGGGTPVTTAAAERGSTTQLVDSNGASDAVAPAPPRWFYKGLTYAARLDLYTDTGTNTPTVRFGFITASLTGTSPDCLEIKPTASTAHQTIWLTWAPKQDYNIGGGTSWVLWMNAPGAAVTRATFSVYSGAGTLPDRRGFRRTKQVPISAALPSDEVLAEEIGSVWLSGHKTTPGRGTVTVKRGAIRERLTGRTMELEELGLRVGELVCFTDRIDPDTGGWGRSMRLVGVKLNNATDEATLTFDDARADFETLMARLDLAVGSS